MRFKGLDLNLLLALVQLAETQSVSVAAKRLSLSQPAMSAALRRLRQHFKDELLVVSGRRMYPTALLRQITPQLQACLKDLDQVISTTNTFDPRTTRRTFRVIASDYTSVVLLAPICIRLEAEAPAILFNIVPPDQDSYRDFVDGRFDLLLAPSPFIVPEHPAECVFEERYVVAGCRTNPIFARDLTEADVLASGHVAIGFGAAGVSFADRQLSLMGKACRIEVVAPSFISASWMLVGSRRICLMHERLARVMAASLPLAFKPLPFEFPDLRLMVQHHATQENDDGLRWLRGELRAFGQ